MFKDQFLEHYKLVETEIVVKLLEEMVAFFFLLSFALFFSHCPSYQLIEKVQFNLD